MTFSSTYEYKEKERIKMRTKCIEPNQINELDESIFAIRKWVTIGIRFVSRGFDSYGSDLYELFQIWTFISLLHKIISSQNRGILQ